MTDQATINSPNVKGYAAKGDFNTDFAKEHLPGLQELPRLHRPSSKTFFNDFVKKGRPCVITGVMDQWKTHQWGDFEYLKKKIGHHTVFPRPRGGRKLMLHTQGMTFSEFLDQAKERDLYLAIAMLMRPDAKSPNRFFERRIHPAYLPELCDDFEIPFFDRKDVWEVNMWMGPGSSETPLHNDQFDNIYCQVSGRKKFLLFPNENPGFSKDERDANGNITYEGYQYVVEPGDLLYYPKFWYHRVLGEDSWAISINMWFLKSMKDKLDYYANGPFKDKPLGARMNIRFQLMKDLAEFHFWSKLNMMRPQPDVKVGPASHGKTQAKMEGDPSR